MSGIEKTRFNGVFKNIEITKELTIGFKYTIRAKRVTLIVFCVRTITTVKKIASLLEEHNVNIESIQFDGGC